ncbi:MULTISPECIES: DUF1289 domain-containing protein [unclassified Undibacterium]|uniref:DUF1289 domain-containing protein n=1 Tax=unclassified Undibacterium TaxID=2630295 RepID=UPI002AC99AB3|nr:MULTISPECIES: DUF1289 domain-containing protein [unclassified Undibacterium]MEB0138915.1 DUF1289 domain-containing protein [Undibacterium sp. CCC2.1]MEB0171754.1 DUF1289 domain-containing protein [Undibacterium sp. CCC1.1]MEB0175546.1 DUF1289 domain-containing protein [Undibacterium sp. CCC3.4]MEB0214956.1 DUF1289 domain-containing protein [Undibacterium sp. 5I2]WPX44938.1 DUF1289 domain-containing protein [Undibacterium sp. CCC3.4]
MSILYDYDPDALADDARPTIPSPCIGVCRMDEKKAWCAGCFRTIDELKAWGSANDDSKRHIWREVKQRMF